MPTYKDINLLSQKSAVAGTEKLPVSDTEYITPAQITEGLDDILDVGDIVVSTNTETPSTNGTVKDYPAIALVAGRTYKFVIHPNGYVPDPSINAALAIHTANGTTDTTVVQEVIIVTRLEYTGDDITVYYTPTENTSHVRFYVGAAQTVGTGVQFVTSYEDSNRLKTIEESIGDVETLLAAI